MKTILKVKIVQLPTKFMHNYRSYLKTKCNKNGNNRIPKQIIAYKPKGKRSWGSPLKRWHETVKRAHGLFPYMVMLVTDLFESEEVKILLQ
jgi:hypothetical protein